MRPGFNLLQMIVNLMALTLLLFLGGAVICALLIYDAIKGRGKARSILSGRVSILRELV